MCTGTRVADHFLIGSIEQNGVHCTFGSAAHSMHRTVISRFPSYPIMSPRDMNTPRLIFSYVETYGMFDSGDVTVTDVARVLVPRDLTRLSDFAPVAWNRF